MAYCTQDDLLNQMPEQELVELTDDAGAGTIDTSKVDDAIKEADGTIDGYAGGRYPVPLTVTDKVRSLSRDITVYLLEKRRRRIREATKQGYDDAIAYLKDVARGTAVLDGQVGGVGTDQASGLEVGKPDREADPRVFEDSKLEGF